MKGVYNRLSYKLLIFVVLLAYSILSSNQSHALYDNCILSDDFGDTESQVLGVMPIGQVCYERCQIECKSFARQSVNGELNSDIISNCVSACQSGSLFSANVREANIDKTQIISYTINPIPITTQVACGTAPNAIDSPNYNYFDSAITVNPNDKIIISIISLPNQASNTIYMCGFNTVKIYPVFYSLNPLDWTSNSESWNSYDYTFNSWHARNSNFLNTGINFKNGDWLSITYGWPYKNCDHTAVDDAYQNDTFIVRTPYNDSTQTWSLNSNFSDNIDESSISYVLPGSNLKVMSTNIELDANNNPVGDGNSGSSAKDITVSNNATQFMGLKGNAWSESRTNIDIGLGVNNFKYKVVNFSGIIDGFSDTWTRLGIKHGDGYSGGKWTDNLGGKAVQVDWKGCPFQQGERLQYVIVPNVSNGDTNTLNKNQYDLSLITDDQWVDVEVNKTTVNGVDTYNDSLHNNQPIIVKGNSPGSLFFRIKPFDYDLSQAPNCPNDESICQDLKQSVIKYYNPAQTSGSYYIRVSNVNNPTQNTSILTNIITNINEYLYGNDSKSGKIQILFNELVTGGSLLNIIRAVLTFYIAFTGLTFVIGVSQITQQDATIRLVKIGIILTLISPNSWVFFNTYLFRLFTDGLTQLIAYIASPLSISAQNLVKQNPVSFFSMLDDPFWKIFNIKVFYKIIGLTLSTYFGFILGIVVLLALIFYIVSMVKAIIIYLVAVIGIAILLMLAPIFISLVLFKYTRQYFDAWLKQLFNFVTQPLLVFAILTILNNLLLFGMYITLSFSVCKTCLLSFSLPPLVDTGCLISGWITLKASHYPAGDFLGMPITLISSILFFLIIAQATFVLCDFCAKIGTLLIAGSFFGIDLGKLAQDINPKNKLTEPFKTLFGEDETSKYSKARFEEAANNLKQNKKKRS